MSRLNQNIWANAACHFAPCKKRILIDRVTGLLLPNQVGEGLPTNRELSQPPPIERRQNPSCLWDCLLRSLIASGGQAWARATLPMP